MLVSALCGVQFSKSEVELLEEVELSLVLKRGLNPEGQRCLDNWGIKFEQGKLQIVEDDRQVLDLLDKRPDWISRLSRGESRSDKEALVEIAQQGQQTLVEMATDQQYGLPLATSQQVEQKLAQLEGRQLLHRQDQETWLLAPGKSLNFILEGRAHRGGMLRLLVMSEELALLDLNQGSGERQQMGSLRELEERIVESTDISRARQIRPAPDRVELPPLGGIGELKSWQAYIAGCREPSESDAYTAHPAEDWMPQASGCFYRYAEGNDTSIRSDPLRSAVQLYCSGSIIHLGHPAQERRLNQNMPSLDLYRPANPYGAPPIPVKDKVRS